MRQQDFFHQDNRSTIIKNAMTSSVDEKKAQQRLRREIGRAIQDFQMIREETASWFASPVARILL